MGAWPFLVGGVICLLNCDNERDLDLLNSQPDFCWAPASQRDFWLKPMEVRGNNRLTLFFTGLFYLTEDPEVYGDTIQLTEQSAAFVEFTD